MLNDQVQSRTLGPNYQFFDVQNPRVFTVVQKSDRDNNITEKYKRWPKILFSFQRTKTSFKRKKSFELQCNE